jgi:hypothetical protein
MTAKSIKTRVRSCLNNRFQSFKGFKVETNASQNRSRLALRRLTCRKTARRGHPIGLGSSPVSRDRLLVDRPAVFFGSCAPGARWLAQRGKPPGPASSQQFSVALVGPRESRRLGIQCHDGRKMRQRVRLKLPSGLLMARLKPRAFKAKSKPSSKNQCQSL